MCLASVVTEVRADALGTSQNGAKAGAAVQDAAPPVHSDASLFDNLAVQVCAAPPKDAGADAACRARAPHHGGQGRGSHAQTPTGAAGHRADRAVGVEGVAQIEAPAMDTGMLVKTKLCKFYAQGRCTRGRACTFAHGGRELQPQPNLFRTEMCFTFLNRGVCHFGKECKYAHSEQEIRNPGLHKSAVNGSQTLQKHIDGAANTSAHSLSRKLEALQQQAMQLQAELSALQSSAFAEQVTNLRGDPEKDTASEGGISLQTTTQSDSCAAGSFSDHVSKEHWEVEDSLASTSSPAAGSWWVRSRADSGAGSGLATPECEADIDDDSPTNVALVVKNTFFNLMPLVSRTHRRVKSAPAAPRRSDSA